jgi:hypothetical protein
MTDQTPAPWNRFTDTTWASIGWTVDQNTQPAYWENLHDLEYEMADLTGLDVESCQALITAAKSNLPVEITWEQAGGRHAERHTGVAMVDSITLMSAPPRTADRVRVRYVGFSHYVYVPSIRSARLAGMQLQFVDVATCPNPWHSSAPARERMTCPECPMPFADKK